MAYRLRQDESVSKGLKRVVTKELRTAVNHLAVADPSEDAIHGARKSIKKVRAVLQLLGRYEVGPQRDRKRLRRAAHLVSPLRDADALVATGDVLCDHRRKKLSSEMCTVIHDLLDRHKQRLCRAANLHQAGRQAAKALEEIRQSAKDWPWKRVGFAAFSTAMQRSYKKARRDMGRAQTSHAAKDFHQWRKRVKTLWYALRLLEERLPRRRLIADLDRLEAYLGEDHDLMTLRAHLLASRRLPTSARARVGSLSDVRQAELRRKALAVGARAFKATPKAFIRQLR